MGEKLNEGDLLAEIETDKATIGKLSLGSFYFRQLLHVLVWGQEWETRVKTDLALIQC